MTNYSVQSIYTSGERTKANYLTNMIAEDVVGNQELSTTSEKNFSNILHLILLIWIIVMQEPILL